MPDKDVCPDYIKKFTPPRMITENQSILCLKDLKRHFKVIVKFGGQKAPEK